MCKLNHDEIFHGKKLPWAYLFKSEDIFESSSITFWLLSICLLMGLDFLKTPRKLASWRFHCLCSALGAQMQRLGRGEKGETARSIPLQGFLHTWLSCSDPKGLKGDISEISEESSSCLTANPPPPRTPTCTSPSPRDRQILCPEAITPVLSEGSRFRCYLVSSPPFFFFACFWQGKALFPFSSKRNYSLCLSVLKGKVVADVLLGLLNDLYISKIKRASVKYLP